MAGSIPASAARGRMRLVFVVLLLIGVLALTVAAVRSYIEVDEVTLPDVRGLELSEATRVLRDRDLEPLSYPENVPGARIDTVTSQTPPAGTVVRRGRSVSIGVHSPPQDAAAPQLLGLTEEQAVSTARAVNLQLERIEYAHSAEPPGRVIAQRPAPGEPLGDGLGLEVTVSRGPERPPVALPDLVGLPLEEARRRLEALGFRSIEPLASGVSFDRAGAVRAQRPAAGEPTAISTPVVLEYALSAREVVPVPQLVGRTAREAERLLRAAGLQVGVLQYVDRPGLAFGEVVGTSPTGYTVRGAPVALTINAASGSFDGLRASQSEVDPLADGPAAEDADGPPPAEAGLEEDGGRRVPVSFDPANLGVRSLLEQDYQLRLVVQDERGERTLLDRRVRAGERVSAVVTIYGDGLLQTFINDVFFQAWRP